MEKEIKTHLRIHPSAIYQLGESLITDEIQALIELVKNSYDADATFVIISIDTTNQGQIIIEDNGTGMNGKNIVSGWLHVSNRRKANQKLIKKLSKIRKRTPLGDKGLGRLGVQKLGWNLELLTETENNPRYQINIDWNEYLSAKRLNDVLIYPKILNKVNKPGTKLTITNLRNPSIWTGQNEQEQLVQEFSKMISPYKEIREFSIFLEINKQKRNLFSVSEELRNTAHIRYTLNYNDTKLSVTGTIRRDWFKSKVPNSEQLKFDNKIHYNCYFDYLKEKNILNQYPIIMDSTTFDMSFTHEIELQELDGATYLEQTLFNKQQVANPGNFSGEVDYFSLNDKDYNTQVFTKVQDYREAVKAIGGIRVFRDSFVVRTEQDWLRLGAGATSKTYYSLRPENTHGYIAISSALNSQLEETTSRERFKDTPHYKNFFLLLSNFVDYANNMQGILGKTWADYRNKEKEKDIELDLGDTISVSETVKRSISKVTQHRNEINDFKENIVNNIDDAINIVTKVVEKNEKNEKVTSDDTSNLLLTIKQLRNLILSAENILPELNNQINQLEKLQEYANVIDVRFEVTKNQLHDVFETASLGLVAETISHEIHNVMDQVILKSKHIKNHIRKDDIPILTYNEYIISTSQSLKKQISYLDPALKYIREKKDIIDIKEFIESFVIGQNELLRKSNIAINFESVNNFRIKFNEGKLLQILINLTINSEYWIKQNKPNEKKIFIKQIKNNLYIWDSARGIDPSVEVILFEPFVSFKYDTVNRTKGRGLGLYIIKQLLDYSNCSIELVNERNEFNRLYKFKINFDGVLYE